MRIDVKHISSDGKIQQVWTFWVNFPHVILDAYTLGRRTGSQRKYRDEQSYQRIDARNTNLTLDQVPRPTWVESEVRGQLIAMLRIGVSPDKYGEPPAPFVPLTDDAQKS